MDVEKTVQFILEQNASNTVQIAQLREMVLTHESDLQSHEAWELGMSRALQDLASQMKAGFATVAEKHAGLADKLADLADKHADLADKHAELRDMQKATQENLNILIHTVRDIIPRLPK